MSGLIRFANEYFYPIADGNVCVMTGHVGLTGIDTPTDADVDQVISILGTWWETGVQGENSVRSLVVGDCQLRRIVAQKIRPTPAAPAREGGSGASVGTRAGTGLPPQIAVCVSLRTNVATRRARGRMYLPGIAEADVSPSGLISVEYQDLVADCFDGLRRELDTVAATVGEQVVFSRLSNTWERVTSVRVGNRADTQRRRRIRDTTYLVGA